MISEGPGRGADPRAVRTLAELKQALDLVRGSRSYADLSRSSHRGLSASTLSDLLRGRSTPRKETVVAYLAACEVDEADLQPWIDAWERVARAGIQRSERSIRVRTAKPRTLGVHASIMTHRTSGELPPYVPRDVDADIRAAVDAAASTGGFVLLVGSSSVGKTRTLFEVVNSALPDWWLLHPEDAAEIRDYSSAPAPQTVLWLDELQNYLDQPGGLPVGRIRRVINSGNVVVATLWHDEYDYRTSVRSREQGDQSSSSDYGHEKETNDRQLLDLAQNFVIDDDFSDNERHRAKDLSFDDRVRTALSTEDAGFTQVMAGGPEVIRRWSAASDPYGKAITTAALDARRMGVRAAIVTSFLEAAAPYYLSAAHQATLPTDWFSVGLAYATDTKPVHGATAPLTPVPGSLGSVSGYRVADFLYQHALVKRRAATVPDSVWDALLAHHHLDDAWSLAVNADHRGKDRHAAKLYGEVADDDEEWVDAARLAELLSARGEVDELRRRFVALDDDSSPDRAGQWHVIDYGERLGDVLESKGQIAEAMDVWRKLTAYGSEYGLGRLATLLDKQGRTDDAIAALKSGAEREIYTYDLPPEGLEGLLAKQGRYKELQDLGTEEAFSLLIDLVEKCDIATVRELADDGILYAAERLARHLAEEDLQAGAEVLKRISGRRRADAILMLADLLVEHGRVDEAIEVLEPEADAGYRPASYKLAQFLASNGRINHLQRRAEANDEPAMDLLNGLLARSGNVDELRRRVETGDVGARQLLGKSLENLGRADEAIAVWRPLADEKDNVEARKQLAFLLKRHGRLDELRERTQNGDPLASWSLAELLLTRGEEQELWALAREHNHQAADVLAHYLVRENRIDDALSLCRQFGLNIQHAVQDLVDLLVRCDRFSDAIDFLRDYRASGNLWAQTRLAMVLALDGRVDELRERADNGDWDSARQLVKLLAEQGRTSELLREVAAGTPGAADMMRKLEAKSEQGRLLT